MSDNGKNGEEYAPDPQVDRLLEELATAVPAESVLQGFEDRVMARLAKEIPVLDEAPATAAGAPAEAAKPEAADAKAAATADAAPAAPAILIPQARRSKAPIFVGLGILVIGGLSAAAVYMLMRPPETEVITKTVEETTYVPVVKLETAAPVTAAPEPPETIAMVDPSLMGDASMEGMGEEIGAPSGTTDDGEYVPEDETARLMAEARAKLKASKGKKKPAAGAKPAADDGDDDLLDDSPLPATSAPEPATAKPADPGTDPSKAGAFEKDLEELLKKKKAAAAGKPVATAAPAPTRRTLKKTDVKKEIDRAKRKIGSCGAIDSGTVTVTWFVEGSGSPSKVAAKAPHSSTALGACVTNIIKGLKFPEHDEDPVKVSYPFVVSGD